MWKKLIKLVSRKGLKRWVGLVMAVLATVAAVWGPFPTLAADTGGAGLATLSEGAIEVVTKETAQVPVENYKISQGYRFFHPGVDLAAKLGEPVKPVAKGKVILVAYDKWNYGNHIIIDHGGYQSLYGHLSRINVVEGQEVDTETIMGEVGSSGRSTGPHLHLEIREGDKTVNPKSVLDIK
ncbi:MAG: Peptidase M23 [Candidatus Amesbacteria bacterium GW2011_GWB1_47_26]|uniref:Peptidase M23 n=1 Tax=Candidatus Amesbacteria bacterium GW2011_GWC2_45_19 TaxID=1618366 RepID=A0A0G1M2V4_9BACT|nr:MAG: Peptidase M23 [Candidatus Amesbacteria bacterium GW2011_GWC2_45_19]KKU37864.1 MAG: Peptidase M23 [Candidatus Amesbacteria bacterium GW2011_GWA1_46_35]KKU69325.1 MAG: Peptidase M23 [Microgenomates group bacterium GW2011_GWC1_47_20]KKU75041.1 MAG: Peptidase M23 [Candidatus Amesbacteria bacterium GW2011_GWB1_47_26]